MKVLANSSKRIWYVPTLTVRSNMKSHKAELKVIDGCGSELLDIVMATVNYELSGDGAVLVHTDDLNQGGEGTHSMVEKITDVLNTTCNKYEGLVLLRR